MSKIAVELDYDQVDKIVIAELQGAYRRNIEPTKMDNTIDIDEEFLNAIDCVLDYYMTTEQKADWVEIKRVIGR